LIELFVGVNLSVVSAVSITLFISGVVLLKLTLCIFRKAWNGNIRVKWLERCMDVAMMGHDAHVAMLLGSAKILQEHRDELQVS
jgi:hypothetical protein